MIRSTGGVRKPASLYANPRETDAEPSAGVRGVESGAGDWVGAAGLDARPDALGHSVRRIVYETYFPSASDATTRHHDLRSTPELALLEGASSPTLFFLGLNERDLNGHPRPLHVTLTVASAGLMPVTSSRLGRVKVLEPSRNTFQKLPTSASTRREKARP